MALPSLFNLRYLLGLVLAGAAFFIAVYAVIIAATDVPEPVLPASGEPLYFEPLGRGTQAQLADTTELFIRDAATWAAYRDSLNPVVAFPEVDFTQAGVVLVALPQITSGYGLEVESVERFDDEIVVRYLVSAPGDDCLTASALTVPFAAVQVRRAAGDVRFERLHEEYACTFDR